MKNLFSLDNPFIQFLAQIGDMIIVNFLFLICCIPVVTIGAASAALHKVMQDIVCDNEKGVFKTYFRAFKENFKQATLVWLVMLVFFVGMLCNYMLVLTYFEGNVELVLSWVLGIIVILLLAVTAHLFPLIVRYDNTLKEHIFNAGILAVVKLPRTVAMVFLNILPFLILYFSVETFLNTMVFWLFVGFGFTGYLCSTLMAPVFTEMEKPDGPEIQIMK